MSDSHARRAKPSRLGAASRRGWLVWAAVPLAMIAPIAGFMAWDWAEEIPRSSEEIEDTIRDMNFHPLLPPSRLRAPGAIYAVVNDGSYWKICDDPELVRDKIHSSPIPDKSRNKLEKAAISAHGNVIEKLNAGLSASRIVSMEYRMSNVSISEIAMRDLFVIQKKLMSDKDCDEMVSEMLKRDKKVCLGYAVVTASTSYKVKMDTSVESGGTTQMQAIEAVQRQIALETKGEIKLTDGHELVGQDLYYGIQLSPVCLTLNTATVPSRLDDAREDPSLHLAPKPVSQKGT
jgi:hypothetical protein